MNLSYLIFLFSGVFSALQGELVYLFGFDLLSGFCFGFYFLIFLAGIKIKLDERRGPQGPLG